MVCGNGNPQLVHPRRGILSSVHTQVMCCFEAWVLGIIAGHVVQKIAAALELDGVDSDTIKSLARLGHFGSYPNTQGVC